MKPALDPCTCTPASISAKMLFNKPASILARILSSIQLLVKENIEMAIKKTRGHVLFR